MRPRRMNLNLAGAALLLAACARPAVRTPVPAGGGTTDREIRITLLHLNDIYEIKATGDGTRGGPARVATLRRQLLSENPNTFTVLGGDALSPSALGTARVDGERLQGRQMVAVLNTMGLDYAAFGNHEFDLASDVFLNRLRESRFTWLSVNVRAAGADPLPNTASHIILRVAGAAGDTVRIAMFGVTMDRDQNDAVRIADPVSEAVRAARLLRDSAEIVVAVTHLPFAQDIRIAESALVDLVAGGHDHENLQLRRGPAFTTIAKADANARSVFVHELRWNAETGTLRTSSTLVPVTAAIPADSATARVAEGWVQRAYDGFRQAGFEPEAVVADVAIPLDGLESSVLNDTTALSTLISRSMLAETGAEAAVYNAGSIRIDDVLPPGPVTQYDVIRVLPFGGPILEVELSGALLRRTLDQGELNRGTGGFLQSANIAREADGAWRVAGTRLDDGRTYRVAVSDFLLSGREQGFDWLTRDSDGLRVLRELRDVRSVLIDGLAREFPVGR